MPDSNFETENYILSEGESTKNADEDFATIAGQMLRSAAYSAIQRPVDGVTQLIDHVAGTNTSLDLISAPLLAPEGSNQRLAQHMGAFIGTAPAILAVHKTIGLGFGNSATMGFGAKVGHAALTGAVFEGVLKPVSDVENFWEARATNAFTGAAVYSAASLAMQGMGKLTQNLSETNILRKAYNSPGAAADAVKFSGSIYSGIMFDETVRTDYKIHPER